MEIRRVDHNTYDIFTGKQWGTHSRVRQAKHNTYVVFGNRQPHGLLKFLHSILAPNMPINYGQNLETTLLNCQVLSAMGK